MAKFVSPVRAGLGVVDTVILGTRNSNEEHALTWTYRFGARLSGPTRAGAAGAVGAALICVVITSTLRTCGEAGRGDICSGYILKWHVSQLTASEPTLRDLVRVE